MLKTEPANVPISALYCIILSDLLVIDSWVLNKNVWHRGWVGDVKSDFVYLKSSMSCPISWEGSDKQSSNYQLSLKKLTKLFSYVFCWFLSFNLIKNIHWINRARWLSGLERQSNSWPMLKVPSSNPATAMDLSNNDSFSVCRFVLILIDCIETVALS